MRIFRSWGSCTNCTEDLQGVVDYPISFWSSRNGALARSSDAESIQTCGPVAPLLDLEPAVRRRLAELQDRREPGRVVPKCCSATVPSEQTAGPRHFGSKAVRPPPATTGCNCPPVATLGLGPERNRGVGDELQEHHFHHLFQSGRHQVFDSARAELGFVIVKLIAAENPVHLGGVRQRLLPDFTTVGSHAGPEAHIERAPRASVGARCG